MVARVFGRSLNLRTKNDPVDARLIAAYTLERVPPRFKPLEPKHQELRDASRRRQQLLRMIAKEKNHLSSTACQAMIKHVDKTLGLLEGQLKEIDEHIEHIEQIIVQDAQLSRNRELLYMPAMSLLTIKSGPLKDFAQRLLQAAKQRACVVGALMRKLMALAFAILRSGRPYDPLHRPASMPVSAI